MIRFIDDSGRDISIPVNIDKSLLYLSLSITLLMKELRKRNPDYICTKLMDITFTREQEIIRICHSLFDEAAIYPDLCEKYGDMAMKLTKVIPRIIQKNDIRDIDKDANELLEVVGEKEFTSIISNKKPTIIEGVDRDFGAMKFIAHLYNIGVFRCLRFAFWITLLDDKDFESKYVKMLLEEIKSTVARKMDDPSNSHKSRTTCIYAILANRGFIHDNAMDGYFSNSQINEEYRKRVREAKLKHAESEAKSKSEIERKFMELNGGRQTDTIKMKILDMIGGLNAATSDSDTTSDNDSESDSSTSSSEDNGKQSLAAKSKVIEKSPSVGNKKNQPLSIKTSKKSSSEEKPPSKIAKGNSSDEDIEEIPRQSKVPSSRGNMKMNITYTKYTRIDPNSTPEEIEKQLNTLREKSELEKKLQMMSLSQISIVKTFSDFVESLSIQSDSKFDMQKFEKCSEDETKECADILVKAVFNESIQISKCIEVVKQIQNVKFQGKSNRKNFLTLLQEACTLEIDKFSEAKKIKMTSLERFGLFLGELFATNSIESTIFSKWIDVTKRHAREDDLALKILIDGFKLAKTEYENMEKKGYKILLRFLTSQTEKHRIPDQHVDWIEKLLDGSVQNKTKSSDFLESGGMNKATSSSAKSLNSAKNSDKNLSVASSSISSGSPETTRINPTQSNVVKRTILSEDSNSKSSEAVKSKPTENADISTATNETKVSTGAIKKVRSQPAMTASQNCSRFHEFLIRIYIENCEISYDNYKIDETSNAALQNCASIFIETALKYSKKSSTFATILENKVLENFSNEKIKQSFLNFLKSHLIVEMNRTLKIHRPSATNWSHVARLSCFMCDLIFHRSMDYSVYEIWVGMLYEASKSLIPEAIREYEASLMLGSSVKSRRAQREKLREAGYDDSEIRLEKDPKKVVEQAMKDEKNRIEKAIKEKKKYVDKDGKPIWYVPRAADPDLITAEMNTFSEIVLNIQEYTIDEALDAFDKIIVETELDYENFLRFYFNLIIDCYFPTATAIIAKHICKELLPFDFRDRISAMIVSHFTESNQFFKERNDEDDQLMDKIVIIIGEFYNYDIIGIHGLYSCFDQLVKGKLSSVTQINVFHTLLFITAAKLVHTGDGTDLNTIHNFFKKARYIKAITKNLGRRFFNMMDLLKCVCEKAEARVAECNKKLTFEKILENLNEKNFENSLVLIRRMEIFKENINNGSFYRKCVQNMDKVDLYVKFAKEICKFKKDFRDYILGCFIVVFGGYLGIQKDSKKDPEDQIKEISETNIKKINRISKIFVIMLNNSFINLNFFDVPIQFLSNEATCSKIQCLGFLLKAIGPRLERKKKKFIDQCFARINDRLISLEYITSVYNIYMLRKRNWIDDPEKPNFEDIDKIQLKFDDDHLITIKPYNKLVFKFDKIPKFRNKNMTNSEIEETYSSSEYESSNMGSSDDHSDDEKDCDFDIKKNVNNTKNYKSENYITKKNMNEKICVKKNYDLKKNYSNNELDGYKKSCNEADLSMTRNIENDIKYFKEQIITRMQKFQESSSKFDEKSQKTDEAAISYDKAAEEISKGGKKRNCEENQNHDQERGKNITFDQRFGQNLKNYYSSSEKPAVTKESNVSKAGFMDEKENNDESKNNRKDEKNNAENMKSTSHNSKSKSSQALTLDEICQKFSIFTERTESDYEVFLRKLNNSPDNVIDICNNLSKNVNKNQDIQIEFLQNIWKYCLLDENIIEKLTELCKGLSTNNEVNNFQKSLECFIKNRFTSIKKIINETEVNEASRKRISNAVLFIAHLYSLDLLDDDTFQSYLTPKLMCCLNCKEIANILAIIAKNVNRIDDNDKFNARILKLEDIQQTKFSELFLQIKSDLNLIERN